MIYTPRVAESTLRRYLKAFPVVGLTGPRQSGKSTLLQHVLPDYQYVTFDDPKNILSFTDDPEGFLKQHAELVIFDEVQYVPEIFNRIKILVDNNRQDYGRFVLTGSSQFKFLQHATESLAGRIGLMSLLPFQYSEMPKALVVESIYRGSYPELVNRDYYESNLWYASYLETYLSKDVRALSNIGDMRDFRRFIQLLAAHATQLLDMSLYSRDLGVSVPTIKRWLSVLEASYIIFILPPFYENFGKRITKSPKVYFYDTGFISYFTGITTTEQYNQGPMAGSIFENYVVSEIMKKELHKATLSDLYYFRTQDQVEIDLIVDRKSSKDFIEIKKSSTFHPGMIRGLKKYTETDCQSLLLYMGDEFKHRDVRIMPYWQYLEA
jgi:predicted AAA+ superfamily ATPase